MAIFLRAAKMFSARFIAEAFLDHVYELIACIRRANENAGYLMSVLQFLMISK